MKEEEEQQQQSYYYYVLREIMIVNYKNKECESIDRSERERKEREEQIYF